MDMQAQLQAIRQQFADELSRRDSQIEALSSTITNLQSTVTALRNPSESTLTPTRRPKRQLPDPPKFDGTQLHYDTWLAQLQLVLSVDGDAIGDAQAQFAFVYLRLESSPAALCLELLKHANLTKTYKHQLIIDQLDRHNGVENKVQRAKTKLHKLVQSGSFHGFLISFEVTLGEAGGWTWDDERKIDTLRPCLSEYLKRKLQEHDVAGTTPSKYLDFVSLCKRYASQPANSTSFAPASGTTPNQPRPQLYDHKADKMDLSMINVIQPSESPRGSQRSRSPSPDRSHCYRCGSTDHFVSLCPIQAPRNRMLPEPSDPRPVHLQRTRNGKGIPISVLSPAPAIREIEQDDLEHEVQRLGIETVLDLIYEFRAENDIESDDESLIHH